MEQLLIKSDRESKQLIGQDLETSDGIIEPYVDFTELLKFYYYNVYHQRSIKLKAGLLSKIAETDLQNYMPKNEFAKQFLQAFVTDLEIYGTAGVEIAGTQSNFSLYNVLGYQLRVDREKEIHQIDSLNNIIKLEGRYVKYYSPIGNYYGEPDYLTALEQIITTKKADRYNSNFFDNNARPDMAIIYENSSPNRDQVQAFGEFFKTNYKGYENAHKALILHTGKTTEGQTPAKVRLEKLNEITDISFENLKKITREEIVAAHGVPPSLVGVSVPGKLGAGRELIDQLHSFNEIVMKTKIETIESFFGEVLKIKLKIKELDVTNFKDDADLVTNLVQTGIISQIQAREILGYE